MTLSYSYSKPMLDAESHSGVSTSIGYRLHGPSLPPLPLLCGSPHEIDFTVGNLLTGINQSPNNYRATVAVTFSISLLSIYSVLLLITLEVNSVYRSECCTAVIHYSKTDTECPVSIPSANWIFADQ